MIRPRTRAISHRRCGNARCILLVDRDPARLFEIAQKRIPRHENLIRRFSIVCCYAWAMSGEAFSMYARAD